MASRSDFPFDNFVIPSSRRAEARKRLLLTIAIVVALIAVVVIGWYLLSPMLHFPTLPGQAAPRPPHKHW